MEDEPGCHTVSLSRAALDRTVVLQPTLLELYPLGLRRCIDLHATAVRYARTAKSHTQRSHT